MDGRRPQPERVTAMLSQPTTLACFGGIVLIGAIDRLIPASENPHEARGLEELRGDAPPFSKLLRMGVMSAAAIATHNVPEGIAVSVPISYATGSRRKAFFLSFLSGLAEPVGAPAGYFLLLRFLGDAAFALAFAAAGIMVFISIDGLLPAAERYGEHHAATYSIIAGMAVMAASLLLFS